MAWKRLAVIVAAAAMMTGLNVPSATAAAARSAFEGVPRTNKCLDYRSDPGFGVYLTDCNGGGYQTWYWDDALDYTALRQKATGLCLTVRSGLLAMKPCLAGDKAAYWSVQLYAEGAMILNKATETCLARNTLDRVQLSFCTGGTSQRWTVRNLG